MRSPVPIGIGLHLRELLLTATTQRVFSVLTLLIVAGSTATVLLTSGRSAGAQAAVLETIDAQGTRVVTIQTTSPELSLGRELVDALAGVRDVESVVGFGPVSDVTAAAVPDGPRIGVRTGYGQVDGQPFEARRTALGAVAWASQAATDALGLPPGSGALRVVDGPELLVSRRLDVPDFLRAYEPLTVVPLTPGGARTSPITTVGVVAATAQSVDVVSGIARSLLADLPTDQVSVATSEQLGTVRAAVDGQLAEQNRAIVLGVVASSAVITLVNVYGFVLLRRRDLGRRRALGASRTTIVVLVVGQVMLTATLAGGLGAAAALAWLRAEDTPPPSPEYAAAVVVALVCSASLAAAIPAVVAARRDPLRELRVP